MGVFWDMTELKRAEAMRIAKEAAESANRAKDDFLATVSHDLTTPIGAIMLLSELMRREVSSEAERQNIDRIMVCAECSPG